MNNTSPGPGRIIMTLISGHALTTVLLWAQKDPTYRKDIAKESKHFWVEALQGLKQENLVGEYQAEFAIAEYLIFLCECILECGQVRMAFEGESIPTVLMEALYDSICEMLDNTNTVPGSICELDLLMTVMRHDACERGFVLADLALSGKIKYMYTLSTLLLSLCESDDHERAYGYISRLAGRCRSPYNFELERAILGDCDYESFTQLHLRHLVKGYARARSLAQFVVNAFSGLSTGCEDDDTEFTDIDESYANLLLFRYTFCTQTRLEPQVRQTVLEFLAQLLKENFLTEDDFFKIPVCAYTTQNIECIQWFDDNFGGRERFLSLWKASSERNNHNDLHEYGTFPPSWLHFNS